MDHLKLYYGAIAIVHGSFVPLTLLLLFYFLVYVQVMKSDLIPVSYCQWMLFRIVYVMISLLSCCYFFINRQHDIICYSWFVS